MRTFSVEFLGCKVNAYEVEALAEGLRRLGLRDARAGEGADLYVLNTCAVTGQAGATSRNRIRRARRRHPQAQVLVTGCYVEADRDGVAAIPGVRRVFRNDEKEAILGFVARNLLGRSPAEPLPPLRLVRMGAQTRAFVKIEDGCDDTCTFCIIPALRGPARSRDPDDIVMEVGELVRSGHKEIVLTGVHLGYFGKGGPRGRRGAALIALLDRLRRIPGLIRLKLSSIEVHEITEELVELFAADPVFAPHFHLPLQAGCDRTLRRMRRRYDTRRFSDRLGALRKCLDDPAVSTDVIVGFPGETGQDFEETLAFCRAAAFMKIHVFPYSVREGTPAADLDGRLPPQVVDERKQALLQLDQQLGDAWRHGFLGRDVSVLVEGRRDAETGLLTGLTERYLRVLLAGPDRLFGEIVPARVTATAAGAVVGERAFLAQAVP